MQKYVFGDYAFTIHLTRHVFREKVGSKSAQIGSDRLRRVQVGSDRLRSAQTTLNLQQTHTNFIGATTVENASLERYSR